MAIANLKPKAGMPLKTVTAEELELARDMQRRSREAAGPEPVNGTLAERRAWQRRLQRGLGLRAIAKAITERRWAAATNLTETQRNAMKISAWALRRRLKEADAALQNDPGGKA
jgi:hypothetical protein